MHAEARRAIEAILMVADQPIEPNLLAQVCEIPVSTVEQLCAELAAAYETDQRGFVLVRVAGGYRFQSHPDLAPYVERFVLDGQSAKLSNAALETLAIVAYKQPLSRAQVAAIRGVNVDGVMRTLQGRGYIDEVGKDPGPGNATLFGTTPLFLERLGLDRVEQLPALGAFVPGADVVEQLERTLRVTDAEVAAVAEAATSLVPEPDTTVDTPPADEAVVDEVANDAVAAAEENAVDDVADDAVIVAEEIAVELADDVVVVADEDAVVAEGDVVAEAPATEVEVGGADDRIDG